MPRSSPFGVALALAGVTTFAINAGLTPWLRAEAPFAESAASTIFLWRQGLSAVVAVLLLFGAIGVHLRQAGRSGRFGGFAFLAATVGSALLLAQEWNQVFFVRDLALRAPDLLNELDEQEGLSLSDLGSLLSFAAFSLGWIALAASALRSGAISRRGPVLVIAGFFATPMLGAALPGVLGVVVGNGVLGSGWFLMGRDLRAREGDDPVRAAGA